jgi:hypothetical protein
MTDEKELEYRYLLYRALGLLQTLERAKQHLRRLFRIKLLLPNIDTLRLMLDIEASLGMAGELEVREFIFGLFDDLIPLSRPQRTEQIEGLISDTEEEPMTLLKE